MEVYTCVSEKFLFLDSSEVYLKFPLLNDNNNCGINVIYITNHLALEIQFQGEFKPNLYRIKLAKMILENPLRRNCQFCFGTNEEAIVTCFLCESNAHVKCLERENMFKLDGLYLCFLCIQFRKN